MSDEHWMASVEIVTADAATFDDPVHAFPEQWSDEPIHQATIDCPCSPEMQQVQHTDGTSGWVMVHHKWSAS